MQSLVHRIKVFVFRYEDASPEYLLLRRAQIESFWGPIHGPIGFGEKLETAVRREVTDDTGLGRPVEVLDLHMPGRWTLGDEEIIEWNYGFRATSAADDVSLSETWADFQWLAFSEAYPNLELEHDRAAILRLHTMLGEN